MRVTAWLQLKMLFPNRCVHKNDQQCSLTTTAC